MLPSPHYHPLLITHDVQLLVLHSHHGYGKYLVSGGCSIIVEDHDIGLVMHFDMIETVFGGHLVHCVYPAEVDKYDDAVFRFAFTRHRRTCVRLENYDEWYVIDATASDRFDDLWRKTHARLTTSSICTGNE